MDASHESFEDSLLASTVHVKSVKNHKDSMDVADSFSKSRNSGVQVAHHSLSTSAGVTNPWSYTSIPQYA